MRLILPILFVTTEPLDFELYADQLDLFSCETAFALAATLNLLKDRLPAKIQEQIQLQIQRRIFSPWLNEEQKFFFEHYPNNWASVCSSSIGGAALYLLEDSKYIELRRIAMEMKLKIIDKEHNTKITSISGNITNLVYTAPYEEGDIICLEVDRENCYCEIQLDEAMLPATIFLKSKVLYFLIPFGDKRFSLSPKAFSGSKHLLSAGFISTEEVGLRQNLAKNPYDGFMSQGIFPHAYANIETRNEAVFAARNAIDGIYANESHGNYPYGSWGINQQEDAQWTLDFGRNVLIDELRITLRSDFPHDSYWERASVEFSDGSLETLRFIKTDQPQIFKLQPRQVTCLILKDLVKYKGDTSPFPALTQFEAWGTDIILND